LQSRCVNVLINVLALKIHMSENAHNALKAFPEFITESRGNILVKVKIALQWLFDNFS